MRADPWQDLLSPGGQPRAGTMSEVRDCRAERRRRSPRLSVSGEGGGGSLSSLASTLEQEGERVKRPSPPVRRAAESVLPALRVGLGTPPSVCFHVSLGVAGVGGLLFPHEGRGCSPDRPGSAPA